MKTYLIYLQNTDNGTVAYREVETNSLTDLYKKIKYYEQSENLLFRDIVDSIDEQLIVDWLDSNNINFVGEFVTRYYLYTNETTSCNESVEHTYMTSSLSDFKKFCDKLVYDRVKIDIDGPLERIDIKFYVTTVY